MVPLVFHMQPLAAGSAGKIQIDFFGCNGELFAGFLQEFCFRRGMPSLVFSPAILVFNLMKICW